MPNTGGSRELLLPLARRIRMWRERQRLTQEEFAARCGISVSFASLLERGERSPSYETLLQVCSALGVSLAELFQDAPNVAYDDPYFHRLLDYARGRRLSREQIDRWIAVGQAMFDDNEGKIQRSDAPPCQEPNCQRPVLAKGLCASHYHRARRAKAAM